MTPEQLRISVIKDVLTGKLTQSKGEELKSIDNEYFDIYQVPKSWDIVALEECCYIHARIGWQALRKDEHQKSGDYLLVTGTDFKDGLVDYSTCVYVSKERYEMDEKIQLQDDDILVTKDGSIGKVAVVKDLPMPATLNAGVFVIRPDDRFDKRYIEYLFQCSYFTHFVNLVKSGTTIKHLNQNKLLKFMIPVPQIEEQREIVKVLDCLLPYIDKFEVLENQLKQFNAKFPEDMKKSILQYAIQGKLVEQRPEEGTAEELYQEIQDEKQKLIKEGKIKKKKPLAEITEDEIPFDIPDTWKWVKLGDCVSILGDGIHGTPNYSTDGEYYFINGNNLSEGVVEIKQDTKTVSEEEYEKHKKELNDHTVFVSINGTIGNVAFYNNEKVILGKSACYFNLIDKEWKDYVFWIIKTNYFLKYAFDNATGSTIKNVSLAAMRNFIIPLPPVGEQKRIVKRLQQIIPYCSQLLR